MIRLKSVIVEPDKDTNVVEVKISYDVSHERVCLDGRATTTLNEDLHIIYTPAFGEYEFTLNMDTIKNANFDDGLEKLADNLERIAIGIRERIKQTGTELNIPLFIKNR